MFTLWKYYSQIRVNYSTFNLQEPLSKDQPCALWRMSYSGSFYLHQLKINTMNQILFIITSNYTVQSKSHLKITPTLYRLTFSVVEKSVTVTILWTQKGCLLCELDCRHVCIRCLLSLLNIYMFIRPVAWPCNAISQHLPLFTKFTFKS